MNAIVVADKNWAIGREGGLLFSLPTDMKRFRQLTMGGTVILGRRTLISLPGGKPLPHRRNIVVSQYMDFDFHQEGLEVASSPEAAVEMTRDVNPEHLWVIGGGSIYTALLSQCRRVYVTRVDAEAEDTDTYFPNLDKLKNWAIESSGDTIRENGLTYRFVDYVNHAIA